METTLEKITGEFQLLGDLVAVIYRIQRENRHHLIRQVGAGDVELIVSVVVAGMADQKKPQLLGGRSRGDFFKELKNIALFLVAAIEAIDDALELILEMCFRGKTPVEKIFLILGHSSQSGDDDADLLLLDGFLWESEGGKRKEKKNQDEHHKR